MSNEHRHARYSDHLPNHGETMVARDDRLQASEKIWGSVVHKLKEVAERHGWQNESNEDLTRIARYLSVVSRDSAITGQYRDARSFHANFFEDEYGNDELKEGVELADELTERLDAADRKVRQGWLPENGAKSPEEYYELRNLDNC